MQITDNLLLNGFLAIFIIKEVLGLVFAFLKSKSSNESIDHFSDKITDTKKSILEKQIEINSIINEKLERILGELVSLNDICQVTKIQNDTMYKWHSQEDNDGVKVWYVRKSLSDSIYNLSVSIQYQNDALKDLFSELTEFKKEYDSLKQENFKDQIYLKNVYKELTAKEEKILDALDKINQNIREIKN